MTPEKTGITSRLSPGLSHLTHYFLGDFREANMVMNAVFPG